MAIAIITCWKPLELIKGEPQLQIAIGTGFGFKVLRRFQLSVKLFNDILSNVVIPRDIAVEMMNRQLVKMMLYRADKPPLIVSDALP